jgi:hypothetical protein
MLKSSWSRVIPAAGLVVLCCISPPAFASYAIYVGKNLTTDGSVLIGGSGDEVSSHWLECGCNSCKVSGHGSNLALLVISPEWNVDGDRYKFTMDLDRRDAQFGLGTAPHQCAGAGADQW